MPEEHELPREVPDREVPPPASKEGSKLVDKPSARDAIFESLVEVANKVDAPVAVTVSVGGTLVTGLLIGIREYMELCGDIWSKTLSDPDASRNIRENLRRTGEEQAAEFRKESSPPAHFFHMKQARFLVGGPAPLIPTSGGVLWRGVISEVAGFSFGYLGEGEKR